MSFQRLIDIPGANQVTGGEKLTQKQRFERIVAEETKRKKLKLEEKEARRLASLARCEKEQLDATNKKKAKREEIASRKAKASQDMIEEAEKVAVEEAKVSSKVSSSDMAETMDEDRQVKEEVSHVIATSVHAFKLQKVVEMVPPPVDEAKREASCVKIQSLARMLFAMKQTVTLLSPLVGGYLHDVFVVNQLAYLRLRLRRIVQHAHGILSIAYVRAKRKVEKEKKALIKIQKWFRRRLEISALMKRLRLFRSRLLYKATSERKVEKEKKASIKIQKWFRRRLEISALMNRLRLFRSRLLYKATSKPKPPVVPETTSKPEPPVPEPTSDPEAEARAELYRRVVYIGLRLFVAVPVWRW